MSPTPTADSDLTPTLKDEISLSVTKESGQAGEILGEAKEGEKSFGSVKNKKILAGGFIGLGGGLIVAASLAGNKKKQEKADFDTMEDNEDES